MGVVRGIGVVLVLLAVLAGCADTPAAPPAVPAPAVPPPAASAPFPDAIGPHGPAVPEEPVALARVIETAQRTVADPARAPEDVAAAARTAQVGYEELAFRPERLAPVLAAMAPDQGFVTDRIVTAGRDLLSMAKRGPGEMLPAWRIAAPLSPAELRAAYAEAEERFGVPWTVLAAVNLVESRMGRIASHSEAGAQGPMQFMPSTWASYGLGGDIADPRDAVLGAANYLRANGGATEAGLDGALKRYNNDDRYVRAVRAYAAVMAADERAYLGFHAWEVYFRTTARRVHLPVGYDEAEPVRAVDHLTGAPR
ncbi:lytic transglycosylase domain-containing protein [Actinomycetospora flava]|uniref:Transglycosylase SLT domain-containing protein n=1 Tax=Actinomycetospora flava TaxID=3129232 RepID=A0ABU8MEV9_9PSEU